MKLLSMKEMNMKDKFFSEYMQLIRNHVIPYQWEALNDRIEGAEPSYCMQNFKVASGKIQGKFMGMVFQDSDAYKWLEAVGYCLMWNPDKELEEIADGAIDDICAAQQPDGYLNTYYIIGGLDKRFTNLKDHHELYCLGHMIEAAVVYYQATGKRKFMDTAIRYVDCVNSIFGAEAGKLHGYPGHEVIEMALVRLYEVTKDEKHLRLAKYFIDERGKQPLYFESETIINQNNFHWKDSYFKFQYYQAGREVRQQEKAEGHAVRAVYLYSGMAAVANETGDESLIRACERLWDNITNKQMYITGAIGASRYGESFTFDYDLPNDTIYAETCAAVGLIFFARRMFELTKDSKYMNVLERVLFNGAISGMSLDGTKFFYVNPLEVVPEASEKDEQKRHVKVERQKWFGCACCPPNIARLLSSIGSYAYTETDECFFMNLYIGGDITTTIHGQNVELHVETNYPWDGAVKISFNQKEEAEFCYAIRIPDWCRKYVIALNGEEIQTDLVKGYVYLHRKWKNGDTITCDFNMEIILNQANPKVREDIGKAAISRGPLIYCLEEADNGNNLHRIYIKKDTKFTEQFEKDLLKGIVTLTCDGEKLVDSNWNEEVLYQIYQDPIFEKKTLKWIPYYSWANRNPGEMLVWVRTKV
ncbi:glycoside hydrolase family 127 protein [Anaerocolumna sedimenticola]|uniref:Glycoside hydrolase family 127 protein n=1 Tax=Anaerocolumna sedimenticola TaxID=2696063 RepID=A0A6P1TM15_9FIRM|nr:beta-L-arabinofuranosidase domain-containing protein [Anaerocolumna sedimenticola]QHQ60991.1 glycoside hydrolase family 127 protein [Anaerocolumna sedimenticola]